MADPAQENYQAKYSFVTPWKTVVQLTCFFKFERGTTMQKYGAQADGRPVCNGCGPAGFGAVVPDEIDGCPIGICGDIHNWHYQFGKTLEEKARADRTLGDNIDRIVRDLYEYEVEVENRKHAVARSVITAGSFARLRLWVENAGHAARLADIKKSYNERLFISEEVYERAVRVFGKSAFWDKAEINFTLDDVI